MDEYIQKYLDGDLNDAEAALFVKALARDPALDAELRELEQMLALVTRDTDRDPSSNFSEDVMKRVRAENAVLRAIDDSQTSLFRRAFAISRGGGLRLAWAASFAFVFVIGYLFAGLNRNDAAAPEGTLPTVATSSGQPSTAMKLVRLVYVPQNPAVQAVSVAGTFNGWDPADTEMTRQGQTWVALMTLPMEVYEYMFVEDGQRWVTDPLAIQTRDDGFGRKNAVLDLTM
jgi:anti-sigma factor RsiW